MERWMGAEIQPMFFSPGHAPWWGCIPWRKTDSFVVCTEAPHGPAVTLQGPHAIGSQWVELELGAGVGRGVSLSESEVVGWEIETMWGGTSTSPTVCELPEKAG